MDVVVLTPQARKALAKVPDYIQLKLHVWSRDVEEFGLDHVRKIKGFHDEPLKGIRRGERSIRLSKAYRAIYVIAHGETRIIQVQEVHKHRY